MQQLSLQMEAHLSASMFGFKPLTRHNKSHLVMVMRAVTKDMTRVRDAFDFNSNCLIGKWDVRRGEEEFSIDAQFEEALQNSGFELLRGDTSGLSVEHGYNSIHKAIRMYVSDRDVVIISTELSDNGKHKYHEIRFCSIDVSLSKGKTLQ